MKYNKINQLYKYLIFIITFFSVNASLHASTGGFNFINNTSKDVIVNNFSTLGPLYGSPTLMFNNVCYKWDDDKYVWLDEENNTELGNIVIQPGTNFWIGLTDRNWTEDSFNQLMFEVNDQSEAVSFKRNHVSGDWDILGIPAKATTCPSDDATNKCLNYPDNCQVSTFDDYSFKKKDVEHRKEKIKK